MAKWDPHWNHRSFAGVPMNKLIAECDKLGIDRSNYGPIVELMLTNPERTGRWCFVEALVRHLNGDDK